MRGKRNTCGVLIGRPVRKEMLGKYGRICEKNNKLGLKVVGWDRVDWNNPAHYWEMRRPLLPTIISFLFNKIRVFFFFFLLK